MKKQKRANWIYHSLTFVYDSELGLLFNYLISNVENVTDYLFQNR